LFNKLINTTSLKANLISNYIGSGWSALISIIFVPLYLKYIGAEGYGLIGIFASLQIVLSLLDTGLSTTLNKEVARLSVFPNKHQQMLNLVKTLGSLYWVMAIIAGSIALGLSPLLAKYWVHPKDLSINTITYAFILLSFSLMFQFPSGFYSGGLLGLQKQVILNLIRILFATIRSVGVILVLIYISKSILAFFGWTLLINVLQAFVYRYTLWYYLPTASEKPSFVKKELKNIWKFAAGMTAIGITSILLTQVDKMILSKILPLSQFGYYTFAFTLGSISYMIIAPISQSYFPKFCILIAENKFDELKEIYHQGSQMVTLLILPFSFFLSFFSKEILFIWTHNLVTVENTYMITSVVSIAVAFHCLVSLPYMLCLSYGYTKLSLYSNILILALLIPLTIFSSINYGGYGGAMCWLTITSINLVVNPYLVHKKFLKEEIFKWYWNDTIKPILGCLILFLALRFFLSNYQLNNFTKIILLVIGGLCGFVVTLYSSNDLKNSITNKFLRIKKI
jgi:O-antigen/teichoic acid export membrane protein